MSFLVGFPQTVELSFFDASDNLIDPVDVRLLVELPDGSVIVYDLDRLVRSALGVYTVRALFNVAGSWKFRAEWSSSAGVYAEETAVFVQDSILSKRPA